MPNLKQQYKYEGSNLRLGIARFNNTGARQSFVVTEVGDTAEDLEAALIFVREAVGDTFINRPDLPLIDISGTRLGSTKVIGTLVYGVLEGITIPRRPAFDTAEKFVSSTLKTLKRQLIRPAPANNNQDIYYLGVSSETVYIPIMTLQIATVLDFDPSTALIEAKAYNALNNDEIVINGTIHERGTLRFIAPEIRPIDHFDNVKFSVVYKIEFRHDTWFSRYVRNITFLCSELDDIDNYPGKAKCNASYSSAVRHELILIDRDTSFGDPGKDMFAYTHKMKYPIIDFADLIPTHDYPAGNPANKIILA